MPASQIGVFKSRTIRSFVVIGLWLICGCGGDNSEWPEGKPPENALSREASRDVDKAFMSLLNEQKISVRFEGDRLVLRFPTIDGQTAETADAGTRITFETETTLPSQTMAKGTTLEKDRNGWWIKR